ncbi:MAG: HAD family hydrolase [Thiotrichales bacterium]|nr:HAD family hydrolase [Thiotrichales bacterium]
MALAIFDLDNTLIANDSDFLWGEFLVAKGYVDGKQFAQANARFYEEYKAGTLDIMAYQHFVLKPLSQQSMSTLNQWHQQFMAEYIEPIVLPKALAQVEYHRQRGDTLLIITATNTFITRPIGRRFGIDTLLGTEGKIVDNRYTGEVEGMPTFQQGKVIRLAQWMNENNQNLTDSYFYSDSHNDLPLLKEVTHPVVVDGDAKLQEYARQHGWECISFR